MPNLEQRFWSKVLVTDGCWVWVGALNRDGYGRFYFQYHNFPVHRLAYEMLVGEIPKGMNVCHHCDNPACVNPAHLFVGSHADNMRDRNSKSRQSRGSKRPAAKLTEEMIPLIRADQRTQCEIAADYGVTQSVISEIKTGKAWA